MFTHAITRRPSPEMIDGITTAGLGKPDFDLALKQHKLYCDALGSLGLEVLVLDEEPDFPDGCFVEDTAVVCADIAVIAALGAPSRRGEQKSVEQVLHKFRPLERVTSPASFEGGDVLQIGKTFYIGLSERTNLAGVEAFGSVVAHYGYDWKALECGKSLHFKTDVNWIGDETLLISPFFDDVPELAEFERIVVEDDEAYARNCLYVNGAIIVPDGFPKTLAYLETLGTPLIVLDVSEFRKLDGGLTCLSLRF